MLELTDVVTGYGQIEAVHGASLTVPEGAFVSIVGANGAGKSALLLAITGLLPHSGSIVLDGVDLSRQPAYRRARAGVALVPEGRQVFAGLSVRENLLSGAMDRRARRHRRENYDLVLDLFPRLAERLSQRADSMSGGEQQMVAIGRTLMTDPALLILDEPTLGLSPLVSQLVFDALERLGGMGKTILLVEQNIQNCLRMSDYGYVMVQGRIVLEGSGPELLDNPQVKQSYLSSLPQIGAP